MKVTTVPAMLACLEVMSYSNPTRLPIRAHARACLDADATQAPGRSVAGAAGEVGLCCVRRSCTKTLQRHVSEAAGLPVRWQEFDLY